VRAFETKSPTEAYARLNSSSRTVLVSLMVENWNSLLASVVSFGQSIQTRVKQAGNRSKV
jgi:hypothetical protein